ncbi:MULTISPECIES: shikimate kinase AroK [Methylococcus]|uniref:Shikimate kinase n=1 Tax=Methylococcus capsulatus TaxID=414 RepID=A0ABZ2F7E1_METCP|nr:MULTISPECIES: shikimate kinase AroK [Methylococcus]MDF9391017.1 shikimate kinase AroK [Methylococcus capsulatus]
MRNRRNIFLIGPMGAGKTTVGRLLARALGLEFWDSDKEIERRTGVTVPMIFEYEGEAGFRRRESEVIADLTGKEGIVLATGGGSVLMPENQEHLAARGLVIYLQCSVQKQLERTQKDINRPLLRTENPRQRLEELLRVRDPIYRELADYIVDTGQQSSRNAVRRIINAYEKSGTRLRAE